MVEFRLLIIAHLPTTAPVQRPHNADPREHRWPAPFGNQNQRFHRNLSHCTKTPHLSVHGWPSRLTE
jgi:hypothetical protein